MVQMNLQSFFTQLQEQQNYIQYYNQLQYLSDIIETSFLEPVDGLRLCQSVNVEVSFDPQTYDVILNRSKEFVVMSANEFNAQQYYNAWNFLQVASQIVGQIGLLNA